MAWACIYTTSQNTNSFKVERCRHLIVDEADRLLDLGFEAKLRTIAETLAQRSSSESSDDQQTRQTVMISATLHPGLQALANISMTNPVAVGFSAQQLAAAGAAATAAAAGDGEADGSADKPPAAAAPGGQDEFSIPAQLLQQYVEVPARLRLVALIGELQAFCCCVWAPCEFGMLCHPWIACLLGMLWFTEPPPGCICHAHAWCGRHVWPCKPAAIMLRCAHA